MKAPGSIPFLALLDEYEKEAKNLSEAVQARDREAAWRFKWEHPRFRGKSVTEVATTFLKDQGLLPK